MKRRGYPATWKRVFSAGLIAVLVLAFSVMVYADVFDDFYDYENPDGTYSYYFTQGVTVTLDEDWYQKTMVIAGEEGATFYHKASYEAYKKKGYEGGRLFTIGASVNTDFQKLPSFAYIGFDEEEAMNYFAVLPSDVQAYVEDEAIGNEYMALYSEVEDIIAGIKIEGAENGEIEGSGSGMGTPQLSGGWQATKYFAISEESGAVLDKALEGLTGAEYEPVALLATQVVAGKNYCFLCRKTLTTPGAEPSYAYIYVYEDLEGTATILEIQDIVFGLRTE